MSNDTVIRIENLSKQYRLGLVSTGTVSHDLNRWWCKMVGKEDPYLKIGDSNDRTSKGESDYVWALKDINLEVKRGERIGIIGKNGAGKSTLLKILSQVTGPTTGSVKMKGRVGALLEVGTGFHPELTGRENIYMNGTILGMKRWEVKNKLDEIVDFAGVERYLDTPVKRYSSGMMVRLGFAVAAHLEPDILIVDEVLAVGDAEFQKKAIGKMKEVSEGGDGRTILFVSHNMHAIKKLCSGVVLLTDGKNGIKGEVDNVIDEYSKSSVKVTNKLIEFKPIFISRLNIIIRNIQLNRDTQGKIAPRKPLKIDIEIESKEFVEDIGIQITFSSDIVFGQIFTSNTKTTKNLNVKLRKGINKLTCIINSLNICSGTYTFGFAIDKPFVEFYYQKLDLFTFNVKKTLIKPSLLPTLPPYGQIYFDHEWILNSVKE